MITADKIKVQERQFASLDHAFGPIKCMLNDESVIEIMLNPNGELWVERVGQGVQREDTKIEPADAERIVRLIATLFGREIGVENPSLAGRIPKYNARIQAMVPPIVQAPSFAIRKPSGIIYTLDDYVNQGVMSQEQATYLEGAVLDKKNILVGGGCGSGKTTLGNALLDVVSKTEDRLFIVEDNPELNPKVKNRFDVLVNKNYTYQEAIADSLRLRPDRIIVGEVRDSAALDMIKAWNTGHPGGIATVHANSTHLMLERIVSLIEEAVPVANKRMIADTIDICVYIGVDRKTHQRKIKAISEVISFSNNEWKFLDI